MKRILVIGNSPLPTENTHSRPAAGLRTYQFLKPLLGKERFSVKLITIAMPQCYEAEVEREVISGFSDNCERVIISKDDVGLIEHIQKIHDEFEPEVVIGVNTYSSYIACGLNSDAVIWADLNGWIMAEAQAQAYKMASNDYLAHYYQMERQIVARADKFSTVSKGQALALMGELAGAGRLNKESFAYGFVEAIANGVEDFEGEKSIDEPGDAQLKRKLDDIPEDAFVLLWMGGYNTWVDEVTLFKGIEAAMRENPGIYYVSTGGQIAGLDDKTFINFKRMIDESEFKARFVFLGWVDSSDIPYIYSKADCGLNVDRDCVETWTGARNRINEMMKFGLPVITTLGTEIAGEVGRFQAGMVVKSADDEGLKQAVLAMSRENIQEYGENGRKYIKEECNYEKLQKPLMEWLGDAVRAPDAGIKIHLGRKGNLRGGLRYLRENGLRKFFRKAWGKLR